MIADGAAALLADETRAAFAEEGIELLRAVEVALNDVPAAILPARGALWVEILRALHTLKGAAAVVGEAELRDLAHATEELVRSQDQGEETLDPEVMDEIDEHLGRMHQIIDHVIARPRAEKRALLPSLEGAKDEAPGGAGRPAAADLLRLRPEKVDALQTLAFELTAVRLQQEALSSKLLSVRDRLLEETSALYRVLASAPDGRDERSASRSREVFHKLSQMSASLSGVAQELAATSSVLPLLTAQAGAVSENLEDGLRALRLSPIQPFFEEYAKVVRETAREGQKDVRLTIAAEGAEIDRAVLMRLRDPLSHLVRNAVVHGIEPPHYRAALGKSRAGSIKLECRCEGMRAILQISDDGAGIDVARVRERALSMQLVDAENPLDEGDLLELLVQPGFSTREVADGLAGRGIGLDVVASAVRALDGRLELSTHLDRGTTFTIDVPISASTGLGLVIHVREHSFGILLHHIERIIRIEAADIQSLTGHDTVLIGDAPVAVVSLNELLGVKRSPLGGQKRPAIVLRAGKQRLVVVVDEITGEKPLLVKPLGRAFASAPLFLGAAVQPDGAVLPVLHVAALMSFAADGTVHRLTPRLSREAEPIAPSILVVDDSITMRTLLRNILLGARYKVTLAHDGQAALEALERLPDCRLVITDLHMPRMHGTDLCRAIRRSSRPSIPIIVVTSVGDDAEKRSALEAGADAYIVKSDFEQERFLSVVARFAREEGAAA